MDIMLINIIDIVVSEDQESGEMETKKLYLPTLMHKKDIERAHPGVAASGRLYKNVATVRTYGGEMITVVGNYNDINDKLNENDPNPKIGY